MATLQLDIGVTLRSLSLDIALEAGAETLALVGPSGAGKTTLLRCVAGLMRPATGSIRMGERAWFDAAAKIDLAPEDRSVGFLFQDHALFPHMSVERNVGYASKSDAQEMLESLGIGHLARARPGDLSGGERQRVALARALARRPEVLLLDEPTSNLDARTATSVRSELAQVLRHSGLPALVVTHDFEEAITLAGTVGVIINGRLVQIGAPAELVAAPVDDFVARLTGANVIPGSARESNGLTEVELAGGTIVFSADRLSGHVGIVVHPWDVTVGLSVPADSAMNHLEGRVTSVTSFGTKARVTIGPITAEITGASVERLGLEEGRPAVATFKATVTKLVPLP
jgi:molybdate transport system ATP-binding protein